MDSFMKKFTNTFFLLSLFIGSASYATVCPATNVVTDPPQFQWTHHPATAETEEHYTGVLEMGEATIDVSGQTLTTRAYRQAGTEYTIPGPTLNMQPGKKYVLQFHNTLPYQAKSTQHNVFKDPNISNVHTHGLHISGESPSDDVTRSFEGGFGGDFVYDIPADHMGGTYWYHAHHHGSTFLQVSGGAFGLIIIDDAADNIPANVAAMQEKQLVIGYIDPSAAGAGGDVLLNASFGATFTVNGKTNANMCMPTNTWQHWRILLADRDAKPKTVSVGSQCEVALMSRDGVWRTQTPKDLADNSVSLTGASRADLAVRCSADSTITVGNTTVANVYVDGAADTGPHPYAADGSSQWTAKRPQYLNDLRGLTDVSKETVNMGARTINGRKYDHHTPNFTLTADGAQEWQIKGGQQHPFHLHVYHIQAIGDCGDYEDGEFYDVVAGNCKVRYDLDATRTTVFAGRTIMHCHILQHEDQGAMGWANVIGGQAAPTYPLNASFSEYYNFGDPEPTEPPAAPGGLIANATGSSSINLSWTDNADNETGFEVEQSLDGVNFSNIANLSADSISYADTGLAPETQYTYQVRAVNGAGASAYASSVSATTDPVVSGSNLVVDFISVGTLGVGKGQKKGTATITIRDDQGNAIDSALVTGDFSGTFNEIGLSANTNTDGQSVFETTDTAKGGVSVTFCVTSVTHPAFPDLNPTGACASL